MKRRAIPMTLAVAALLLGACTMDVDEASSIDGPRAEVNSNDDGRAVPDPDWATPEPPQDFNDPNEWWDNEGLSLDILDARLDGAIGPVAQLAHRASDVTSYSDDYWSTISVTVDKDGSGTGAGMAIIDMEGNIMALEGGVYELEDFIAPDTDGWEGTAAAQRPMYIIGCSGDDPGEWSFDQPAEDGEVVVDDSDPDVLTITFTASFGSGSVYDWETGDAREVGASTVTGTVHIAR